MNEIDTWAALERGGGAQRGHFVFDDRHADLRLGKYNGLLDPRGAEALAGALAEQLADSGATLVVVWEDIEDVVLGHVVARQLGVPVLRTFNADGLVGQAGPLPERARAILVTDSLRDPLVSRALRALLERSGGTLLGVAAFVDAARTEVQLLASLVTLRNHLVAPAECPGCRRGEPLVGSQGPGRRESGDRAQ